MHEKLHQNRYKSTFMGKANLNIQVYYLVATGRSQITDQITYAGKVQGYLLDAVFCIYGESKISTFWLN